MRILLTMILALGACSPPRAEAPPPIQAPPPPAPVPPPSAAPAFRTLPSGTQAPLYGIWGPSADRVFVVGDAGLILRSTDHGASWQKLASGTSETLFGVFGVGEDVYACGYRGTLLRSTDQGASWQLATGLGTQATLFGLGGTPGNLYVVGEAGTLLRSSDGVSWTALAALDRGPLYGVWATADETFVVGENGVFRTRDAGLSWAKIGVYKRTDGSYSGGRALWSPGSGELFVSHPFSVARTRDGGVNWESLTSAGSGTGRGLIGFPQGELWAVEADGAILHYSDGYADLKNPYADIAPAPLYAIWGTATSDFYVVGDRGLIQHRE